MDKATRDKDGSTSQLLRGMHTSTGVMPFRGAIKLCQEPAFPEGGQETKSSSTQNDIISITISNLGLR